MKSKFISLLLAFSMLFPSLAHAAEGAAEALVANGKLSSELEAITVESMLTAPLISANGNNYLADSLRLPKTVSDGSEILWESSNEEILTKSGSLKRPLKSVDKVTLTASVTDSAGNKFEKEFAFNVAPLDLEMDGIADFGALEFYRGNDFSGDDWKDSNVFISGHVPNVNDGIAVLARTDQRFYWNNGAKSTVAYVEFIMHRDENESVNIKPMTNNGTGLKLTEIVWKTDNSLVYYTGSTSATVQLEGDNSTKLKLGIYVNDKTHTFSLWADNKLIADNVQMTTKDGAGLQSINFTNSTVGNLRFESYGYYNIRVSDESVVNKDYDLLTFESLLSSPLKDDVYLASSLNLPTKGTNGSVISWESSDEAVIQTDGYVIFPVGQSKDVTLIATITKGDVNKTKSFEFKVASITEEEAVTETLAELTAQSLLTAPLSEDKYLIDPLKLPTRGVGNSAITWASSDKKYIAPDGSIVRPAVDAVNVTLTATVTKGECTNTKDFDFTVAPLIDSGAEIPSLASVIHSDNFESDTLTVPFKDISRINGDFKMSDGRAKLTYSEGDGTTDISFYLSKTHGASSGEYYLEFILRRDEAMTVNTRSFGSGDICITGIDWYADGSIGYYEGSVYKRITAVESRIYELKLGLYINSETDKFSLYLDNELALDNISSRSAFSDFRYMRFYMESKNYTTLEFESYSFYNVRTEMPDSERIALDKEALLYENLLTADELAPGVVVSGLSLPLSGQYGSEFKWETSHNSIITADGSVIRPVDDEFHNVTITAIISSGDESSEKSFDVIVPGINADITDDISVRELICYNDFESDTSDNLLQRDIHNVIDKFGISEGKYRYTSTDGTGGATYLRMYPTATGSKSDAYQGVLGFEVTLGRDKNELVKAILHGTKGIYLGIEWLTTGMVSLGQRNSEADTDVKWLLINKVYEDEIELKCLMDTRRGIYSLWINDELVVSEHYARGLDVDDYYYTEIQWTSKQASNGTVDNHKLYHAVPPTFSRLESDFLYLTESSILTAEPVIGNLIDAPLNLYTQMPFGSVVEWSSSRPDIINPLTGEITRDYESDNDISITLTAKVTNAGSSKTTSFDFVVLREFATAEQTEKADYEMLTLPLLTDETSDSITKYLNLMDKGIYGSDIVWSSSDEKYISPSGKVVRPRWDCGDATVVLTATVAGKYTKEFILTVKADEKPTDPMRMTDEDFFGVWSGNSWSTQPKLDYEYDGMEEVGSAVKEGNYALAKEKLLQHMRNRPLSSQASLSARNTPWVTALANGISSLQSSVYYQGDGTVNSSEYEKITVPIHQKDITGAMVKNYDIIAKYNDTTEIIIAGSNYPDESMRPVMLLYVNGSPRYYNAKQTATVRTGQYMNVPCGISEELKVKMFGEFLGDETYRAMLLFDFADIKETDVIGNAELIFYAKKSTSYSEPKEFYVFRNPNTVWDEATVSWSGLTSYVHNFSGTPGGNTWMNVSGADVEYAFQSCRFTDYRKMMTEYLYTKDESYSYAMVKNIMDFINDCKFGHPRTLDTAVRLEQWAGIFDYLIDIKYVDADICTAIVKTFYNDIQVLSNSTSPTPNWIQTEKRVAYNSSALFPEFLTSETVKNQVVDFYNDAIIRDFYSDGAYVEDTVGYNELALDNYISVRSFVTEAGGSLPKEFDETIRKAAYYNRFLRGPAGEAIGYGDNGAAGAANKSSLYPKLTQWYGDYELQYIDTFGAKGIKPAYTSVHLPESTYTFMRSEWSDDALYLFTNVRGGGSHGHFDDNSLIVMGYGQHLLTDAGYVTYSTGVDRNLALSTKMHNTVSINDENHNHVTGLTEKYGNQGDVHKWTTNSEYDVLSQTTKNYTHIDNSHRRTITFLKSGFWIVSDLCTPKNQTKENSYKQNWHMRPNANVTVSEDGVVSTGFKSGGNIKLASPDTDVNIVQTDGITTSSYGQPEPAPWVYYEKNASGNVSFDTVLLPYEGTSASLDTERIELGVPTDEATAMKFSATTSHGSSTTYYLLDYENSSERTFGKYKSDGFVTVVNEDNYGNITQLLINDGSVIKTSNGKTLVDFGQKVTDASVEFEGNIIKIVTSDSGIDLSKIKINAFKGFTAVTVNGKYMDYDVSGSLVTLSGRESEEVIVNDKNANLGIKDKTDSSQSGGQGGAGSGNNGSNGTLVPTQPSQNLPFSDISAHWAKDYICYAHSKGYVSGYNDGTYRPDNNISRAEFAAMICRSFGLASVAYDGGFADVNSGEWYAEYVSTALANGIISADTYFRPHDTITREEMCKMLAIAMQNEDNAPKQQDYFPAFTDMNDISDWAAEYVAYVCYHGIMKGREDGSFAPKAHSTRAESATVFSRVFK